MDQGSISSLVWPEVPTELVHKGSNNEWINKPARSQLDWPCPDWRNPDKHSLMERNLQLSSLDVNQSRPTPTREVLNLKAVFWINLLPHQRSYYISLWQLFFIKAIRQSLRAPVLQQYLCHSTIHCGSSSILSTSMQSCCLHSGVPLNALHPNEQRAKKSMVI